jgi:hypothetical protein
MQGVTVDSTGNLYGIYSPASGPQTAFKLVHSSEGWSMIRLYTFQHREANSRLTIGADGRLYGAALGGGQDNCGYPGFPPENCGSIYVLQPPSAICPAASCSWSKHAVYGFHGGVDGGYPSSEIAFDNAGNLYGLTFYAGIRDGNCSTSGGCGTLYELSPAWNLIATYDFPGSPLASTPTGHLTFDQAGNIYGTAGSGGLGLGAVFKLVRSGSTWLENDLYDFQGECCGDGANAQGGIVFDHAGDIYGTTANGGYYGGGWGTVFQLTQRGDIWTEHQLHVFPVLNGNGPYGVVIDQAGNLFGTQTDVYKLSPLAAGWVYSVLHQVGYGNDLSISLAIDSSGNIYGTCFIGGDYGYGGIFEITP